MKSAARKKPFVFFASTLIASLSAGFFFVRYALPFELPNEPYSTVLFDRNGFEIGEILSENGFRHRPLESGDVPAFTRRAVVSLEDRRFFSHLGLDPFGIARAFWNNAVL
jgi:membrane carboxypeptidase/penicillin-binding protein PbpC